MQFHFLSLSSQSHFIHTEKLFITNFLFLTFYERLLFKQKEEIKASSEKISKTRELPGHALVNILNTLIFTGNGNKFIYSEILK